MDMALNLLKYILKGLGHKLIQGPSYVEIVDLKQFAILRKTIVYKHSKDYFSIPCTLYPYTMFLKYIYNSSKVFF